MINFILFFSLFRTIKVWRASDGTLCRTLQGHGHWVNVLALNTDYVMRTGAFEPSKAQLVHEDHKLNSDQLKEVIVLLKLIFCLNL